MGDRPSKTLTAIEIVIVLLREEIRRPKHYGAHESSLAVEQFSWNTPLEVGDKRCALVIFYRPRIALTVSRATGKALSKLGRLR